MDPEYIFVTVQRIPPAIFTKQKFGEEPTIFAEYSQLCSRTNVCPVNNGLKPKAAQLSSVKGEIYTRQEGSDPPQLCLSKVSPQWCFLKWCWCFGLIDDSLKLAWSDSAHGDDEFNHNDGHLTCLT